MPIEVYQLFDPFWANNGYKFPNAIPTKFKDKKKFKQVLKLHDYFGGVIRLKGGNWNWCKYKNTYYFLKVIKVYDYDKDVYLYAAIRDIWSNLLEKQIIVRGDILTWNIEEDLTDHLNKCLPILETPARIERLTLPQSSKKWLDDLKHQISEIEANLKQWVISREVLDWVKKRARDEQLTKYKQAREYFFRGRKEFFIFGEVHGELVRGWKEKLKDKINARIKEINDSNTTLVKVGNIAGVTTNKLAGHYALSPKNAKGGILGSPDTAQRITKIDLSGCTDLKIVKWSNLEEEIDPNTDILNNGFFARIQSRSPSGEELPVGTKLCWKLCRRLMLPIGSQEYNQDDEFFPCDYAHLKKVTFNKFPTCFYGRDNYTGIDIYRYDASETVLRRYLYWRKNEKQRIKFKPRNPDEKTKFEEGFLYWVDTLDFILSWKIYSSKATPGNTEGTYKKDQTRRVFESAIWEHYFDTGVVYSSYGPTTTYTEERYRIRAIPHWPYNDMGKVWYFNKIDPSPPYGLLMFQTIRNYSEWTLWEYNGNSKIGSLFYYSGFSKKFWENYGQNSRTFWFNNTATWNALSYFAGCDGPSLSRFMLYLDGIAFRIFTPIICEDYDYLYDYYNPHKLREAAKGSPYYVQDQLNSDYGSGAGLWENPFKNKDTYIRYVEHKRDPAIQAVTLKEKIDLPFDIVKGDFFFTDLEYWFLDYDSDFWLSSYDDVPGLKNKRERWDWRTLLYLGDFLNTTIDVNYKANNKDRPGLSDDLISSHFEHEENRPKAIVLCTGLKGEIEIRVLSTFKRNLNLTPGDTNIVEEVDNQNYKEVRFFHLSKQNFGLETILEQDQSLELNLLHVFYNEHGTKTDRRSNRFLWLEDNDLERSPNPYLIDLVGTDFYVCLKQGDIHIIAKDLQHVQEIEEEADIKYSLSSETRETTSTFQRLNRLSFLEKVNQYNVLNYKTKPFPIQAKFNFHDDDYLNVKLTGLEADHLQSSQDHFLFECKTDVDDISTLLSITKKAVQNQAFLPEQIQLDTLRLEQERADQDYALQLSERDFAKDRIRIARERAEYDINFNWYSHLADAIGDGISFVAKAGATLVGAGAAASAAGLLPEVAGVLKNQNVSSAAIRSIERKANRLNLAGKVGYGISSIRQATGIGGQLFDHIAYFQHRYKEDVRRLKEDEALQLKEVAYNSFKFDQSFFRRKQDVQLQLNNIANSYIRDNVNDTTLAEKFQSKKKLGDTYLTIYLPSEEQLKYLRRYQDEYGIDCDLPNKTIYIKNGMRANVIRLRNLKDEGFIGLPNVNERKYIKAILERGLKIVEIEPVQDRDFFLVEDKRNLENQIRELQLTVQDLQHQLSEGEIKKAKDILKDCEQEKTALEDARKQISLQLQEKEEKIKEIEEQLAQSEASKEIIKKSGADCERDLNNWRNQANQLKAEVADLKTKIKQEETERPAQYWDLCHFLGEFRRVNYDYSRLADRLLKEASYGFNSSEFHFYGWALEFIATLLEDIKNLLDNNTSFAFSENEEIRNFLLQNPQLVTNLKARVTLIFLKGLARRFTSEEWGHIYQVKKLRPIFEDSLLTPYWEVPSQTYKTSILDISYPETMKELKPVIYSMYKVKDIYKRRFKNIDEDYDNSIYKSQVWYDFQKPGGKILFLAYKRYQEEFNENNLHLMHRKIDINSLFNRLHNDTANQVKDLGYTGISHKQYYYGFIFVFYAAISWLYAESGLRSDEFKNSMDSLSPANKKVMELLLNIWPASDSLIAEWAELDLKACEYEPGIGETDEEAELRRKKQQANRH